MDELVSILIITLVILVFVVLGYVMFFRMQRHVRNQYAGYYVNNDPRFWAKRYVSNCPRGCQKVGRDNGNGAKTKWGCPNGEFCYSSQCCKYDQQCSKC